MNYLGIDWGEKKIGLAIGSSDVKVASPFGVLKKKKQEVFEWLKKIIEEEQIDIVVLGKPLKLVSSLPISKEWESFYEDLKKIGLPIFLEDERLSSLMARKISFEDKKNKNDDDAVSAMIILQSYFDKIMNK